MFSLNEIGRSTQRTICMLLSAVIVTVSLSLGALGTELPMQDAYSVTVTQLQ